MIVSVFIFNLIFYFLWRFKSCHKNSDTFDGKKGSKSLFKSIFQTLFKIISDFKSHLNPFSRAVCIMEKQEIFNKEAAIRRYTILYQLKLKHRFKNSLVTFFSSGKNLVIHSLHGVLYIYCRCILCMYIVHTVHMAHRDRWEGWSHKSPPPPPYLEESFVKTTTDTQISRFTPSVKGFPIVLKPFCWYGRDPGY
jgi:hypothetical protein